MTFYKCRNCGRVFAKIPGKAIYDVLKDLNLQGIPEDSKFRDFSELLETPIIGRKTFYPYWLPNSILLTALALGMIYLLFRG